MLVAQRPPLDPMASSHRYNSSYPGGPYTAYAVPAPGQNTRDGNTGTNGLSYAEHELLRSRKTPRGRINELYEIASLDENLQVPAAKHVLLSGSQQLSRLSKQSHSFQCAPRFPSQEAFALPNYNPRTSLPNIQHGLPIRDTTNRPWNYVGGVDSVLHQNITAQDQRYYYYPGSHIPTVLPATYHTQLGPTAPAGQQNYGPYWPDGTFNPYRPAPIRDFRFSGHEVDFVRHQLPPGAEIPPLRRPGRLPPSRDINFGMPDYGVRPREHFNQDNLPFSERVLNYNQTKESNDRGLPYDTIITSERGANLSESLLAGQFDLIPQQDGLRPGMTSEKVAFRDRTFSWAHQVYVELLTKIQRENKLGRPAMPLYGQNKSISKPAIFPKPPQRSGSYFTDFSMSSSTSVAQSYHTNNEEWSTRKNQGDARPSTTFQLARRKTTGHVDDGGLAPQLWDSNRNLHWPQLAPISMPRRVSETNNNSLQYQQYPSSPPIAAVSALETMELLCEEATVPWTDGMLLAGCLAYGLGDYAKALSWYQRILSQDQSHVEAISNLAATLLALGRRDEALQNWSTAVRLRPSYFEAVEHLIGLLCTAHRARDAVELIEYVQSCLKITKSPDLQNLQETTSDDGSESHSRSSSISTVASNEQGHFDYDVERRFSTTSASPHQQAAGFGSSGYAILGNDNGRLLALLHAKGNMLYGLGDNGAAAASFEDAILIATGHRHNGIRGLIRHILHACISQVGQYSASASDSKSKEPILLSPERAQQTAQRMFPPTGQLPGLEHVPKGLAYKAAISTTSNSLLSLAKIYQDGMSNAANKPDKRANGTREILALYYLSLSLQRSPSTANNVGILLASVQQTTNIQVLPQCTNNQLINYSGIAPGSGVALALQYYNYGLNIDPKHAHLYTNLGSLLKDLGQLTSAIKMYEIAVQCDGNFDIALANLANAVKDQGRVADAITYYRRAVQSNPEFAEAVCGLATALNSVCNWHGRGGVYADGGLRDRCHVDEHGKIQEARRGCGWLNRVVEIVDRQLKDGEVWGVGTLTTDSIEQMCHQLILAKSHLSSEAQRRTFQLLRKSLQDWSGRRWEGTRIVRLVERAVRQIGWQWYQDRYHNGQEQPLKCYMRPTLPLALTSPSAPTVLPFHTFTTPLSAKQVRQISQRNALRISVSTLRSPWLPATVYPPPRPPSPFLKVGYVSSDFNNHPLAHLMQSIFGFHDKTRVQAHCYATTSSDGSIHRQQIEREAPVFYDTSSWSVERLVDQIVRDGVHILVNLNGYTRGAKNEVFAARPAPIHMSFMGFAGTLGAEWCDYVFADPISVLPKTLSPWRRNVDIEDRLQPDALAEDQEDWMYAENIIFAKSTFFCVDHKQSAPDAEKGPPALHDPQSRDAAWRTEQARRWRLRKDLFPALSDSAVILGNFNQLYKIDPATFRMYLRILASVPNAVLWLLRFPDIGEQNLKAFARAWAGDEVASRVVFTDVAPKGTHITRASVVDLFLDTPECNAHTTAADVLWSGTPIVTWARWDYKMCSRMASSIVASAFSTGREGDDAREDLLVNSDDQYEKQAIYLASGLRYPGNGDSPGRGRGRLMDLRRMLWEGRWTSRLFDTKRWVKDVEKAYWEAWKKWERGEGGDIWL